MGRSGAQYAQLGALNTFTGFNSFTAQVRINGLRLNQVSKSANYTASTFDVVILVNATGGAVTIQLPFTASQFGCWMVKKTDASANAVTVQGVSGNIDGAATFVLAAQNNAVVVQSDSVNGWVIGKV
jgi:hypothetical protein